MSNNNVTFGLLGCGRVAQRYLEVFSEELKGGKIVACCDLKPDKAEKLANRLGGDIGIFNNVDEMLNTRRPDVVCVLTESGNHYRDASALLKAGVHVVVEKPVTMIPEQAYALAEQAKAAGKMLTVIKQNRWNPAMKALKGAFDSGKFGRIITATIRLRWCRYQEYYEDGWHGTWAMDGGVVNQQAIHHIDALEWICGPVERVCALGGRQLNKLEAEDTMVAILECANGALGTIEATTAARPADIEASISIVGEQGLAVIGGIALNRVETWNFIDPAPEDLNAKENYSQNVPTGYGLGHGPLLQEVVDRISGGDITPVVAADDAVRAVEIIHALYHSWESGQWAERRKGPRSAKLGI